MFGMTCHSVSFMSQSTSSCSDRDTNLPVFSWVIPSIAATAENAQQHPTNIYDAISSLIKYGLVNKHNLITTWTTSQV